MKAAGKPVTMRNQRVAEHVLPQHLALGQALGARGQHVLLADLLEEGVLGQHGRHREAAQHHGRHRQRDVPEVVDDLARPSSASSQLAEVSPRSGNHCSCAAEDHQQRHAQHEARNRIADQHEQRGHESKRVPARTALATPSGTAIR